MEKLVKCTYLVILFGGLFVVTFIGIRNSVSFDSEELNIKVAVGRANRELLPDTIGTLGILDSITYKEGQIEYHMSLFTDYGMSEHYINEYSLYKDVFMYGLANDQALKLLYEKYPHKIKSFCHRIYLPTDRTISWSFTPEEIYQLNLTPAEAEAKSCIMQLKIDGLNLPLTYDDLLNSVIVTLMKVTIVSFMEEGVSLNDIYNDGNTLIWEYHIDRNSNFDLEKYKAYYSTNLGVSQLLSVSAENENVREFLRTILGLGIDLKLKYMSSANNDSLDILFTHEKLDFYFNHKPAFDVFVKSGDKFIPQSEQHLGRDSWTKHSFRDGTFVISIPNSLELRSNSSPLAIAERKSFEDMGEDPNMVVAVFQWKGCGQSTNYRIHYGSVRINHTKSDTPITASIDMNSLTPTEREQALKSVEANYRLPNMIGQPRAKWVDINGNNAIEISYREKPKEFINICKLYMFSYKNEFVTVEIGYREDEKSRWIPDIDDVIKTFEWKH